MADPATQQGQAWPVLPPELASAAPGLPRVFLVEAGEGPPRCDPADVDPLRPETWRPMMRPEINQPPKAGAVALVLPSEEPGPAPAPLLGIAGLAARGLSLLGRLFISAVIIMALGCKGCA